MSKLETFDPATVRTLKNNVVDLIYEAILAGEFKPGERLNESVLARRLRVSRTPIREALNLLLEQGVVTNEPRRGMHVTSLTKEDVREICRVRTILEAEAMNLCKESFDPEVERELSQLREIIDNSGESEAASYLARVDLKFHSLIWSHSGNKHLEKTLVRLTAPLFIFLTWHRRMHSIDAGHVPFLEFLRGESTISAQEVVTQHLLGLQEGGAPNLCEPEPTSLEQRAPEQ